MYSQTDPNHQKFMYTKFLDKTDKTLKLSGPKCNLWQKSLYLLLKYSENDSAVLDNTAAKNQSLWCISSKFMCPLVLSPTLPTSLCANSVALLFLDFYLFLDPHQQSRDGEGVPNVHQYVPSGSSSEPSQRRRFQNFPIILIIRFPSFLPNMLYSK